MSAQAGGSVFTALCGPNRLPSSYVAEMEAAGYALLDNILRPDDVRELKTTHDALVGDAAAFGPAEGRGGLDSNQILCEAPMLAKSSFHPVAMWVIQRYLGVPELHMSHVPSYTITKPATTQRGVPGVGGWHGAAAAAAHPHRRVLPRCADCPHCTAAADYPYRRGRFLDDVYPDAPRFGVQYNVCVDEFTPENGATSHRP